MAINNVLELLQRLPPQCMVIHNGAPHLIWRGVEGFHPCIGITNAQVDTFNRDGGVTQSQIQAMTAGASLGWQHAVISDEGGTPERKFEIGAIVDARITVYAPTAERAHQIAQDRITNWCENSEFDAALDETYTFSEEDDNDLP